MKRLLRFTAQRWKTRYNADLLYARAMAAEKTGNLELLEADLRTILQHEPDHAQALNALGYTSGRCHGPPR